MADVTVWLCDPFGARVFPLAHYDKLVYTRAINDVGELEITLPGHFDTTLVRVDGLIQVWRDHKLDTETAWFVRGIKRQTDRLGVTKVILTAYSGLYLLSGRLLVTMFLTPEAADNMIKAFVRYNMGTQATAARQLSTSLFTVAADTTQAPSMQYDQSYLNLLTACQDIAKASTDDGTPLFFDVVYLPDTSMWELRTYINARGIDKSSDSGAPVTLSVEYGSVGAEQLDEDYSDEITVAYVTADGLGDGRVTVEHEDSTRSGRSPFGRRETHLSLSGDTLVTQSWMAQAEAQRGRPRRTYVADVISTSASQYGRDWTFGDVVTVNAYGQQFNCRVDAVNVTIDNLDGGRESVRVRLTNTATL
jgi:hypothetical protein